MNRRRIGIVFLALTLPPGFMALTVAGGTVPIITLQNNNSTVTIDPNSSAGLESWTVDDVTQQYQQWFWYRFGSGTGAAASIDTLGGASETTLSPAQASVTYSGSNGLAVTLTYSLLGGSPGSGSAVLGETIGLGNGSQATLPLSFFEYSSFPLQGAPNGGYVQFASSHGVISTNEGSSEQVVESGTAANPRDAEPYPETLDNLNNGPATLSQPNSGSSLYGPGDMPWAYQWNWTAFAPGDSEIISKGLTVSGVSAPVPEPSTLALALAGILAYLGLALRSAKREPPTSPCRMA